MRTRITKEECIKALLEANQHVEKLSTNYSELKNSPSLSTIILIFGSWNNAMKAAGIKQIHNSRTERQVRQEAIQSIKKNMREHGKYLTRTQYVQKDLKPGVKN